MADRIFLVIRKLFNPEYQSIVRVVTSEDRAKDLVWIETRQIED